MPLKLGTSNQFSSLLLRWSDLLNAPFHEHFVELIASSASQTVLRSDLRLREKTSVTLAGTEREGIVQSCRREGNAFILTILFSEEINILSSKSTKDPGALAVGQFLTEEDIDRLLESSD